MLRCAIYTRKSSDHGLDQDFNSLDAQHEAAEAYIKSQAHEGWKLIKTHYDDGGLPGGTIERPALQSLLSGIRGRKIDIVVVYKLDRLTPRIRQQPVAIAARRSEVHFRSITCHCANASV
jgi:DNA invertase Pin-like site-specific DNA recombinase